MKPKTMALSGAASLVAWGYLFLYLNINLGPVDILPNWLGMGMMLRALPALGSAVPAAALLRPLASMLAGWQGLLYTYIYWASPPPGRWSPCWPWCSAWWGSTSTSSCSPT